MDVDTYRRVRPLRRHGPELREGGAMSKRGRKRRDRKKNGANHGKRPNA